MAIEQTGREESRRGGLHDRYYLSLAVLDMIDIPRMSMTGCAA